MIVVTGRGLLLASRAGIEDASPRPYPVPEDVCDRTTWLARAAVAAAWRETGGDLVDDEAAPGIVSSDRIGSTISASKIGLGGLLRGLDEAGGDPLRLTPAAWRGFSAPPLTPSFITGPVVTAIGACATGLCSWIRASALLLNDEADLVLAGSAEGTTHPLTVAGFRRLGVLTKTRPRPFDRRRDGFVPAEGAGVAILEREADARARGAWCLARLLGWAQAGETEHAIATPIDGGSMKRLIARALRSADLGPADLSYIHLHGTGTRHNDQAEAAALRSIWDDAGLRVPASSTKAVTGHCLGAAGAVETLLTIEAVGTGVAPGTFGLEERDPACFSECLLDRDEPIRVQGSRHALVLSYGFGGSMAALVIEVFPSRTPGVAAIAMTGEKALKT